MGSRNLFLTLGLCALLAGACERKPEKTPTGAAFVVATTKAREVEWPKTVSVPATISAVDTAQLASRAGGWVTSVNVDAGSHVAKGELLAEVGAADARGRLVEAQARFATAQAALKEATDNERRSRALLRAHDVTEQQYEAVRRRFLTTTAESEAATAAVGVARANLGYAEIRAPFAGIIAEKNVRPGDFAAPGATLFVVASDQPKIRAYVGPDTFDAIKVGDRADAIIDGRTLPATVTLVSAAADPQTRAHLVELRLQDHTAAPYGAYAEARFTLGRAQRLIVPASALVRRAGLLGVFVIDSRQRAQFRLVRESETRCGFVTIEAGLAAGEVVVAAPPANLANNSPVTTAPAHGAMDGKPQRE